MTKYVPRLEGIIHSPSGHISAYNMDNTILLYKYYLIVLFTYQCSSIWSEHSSKTGNNRGKTKSNIPVKYVKNIYYYIWLIINAHVYNK